MIVEHITKRGWLKLFKWCQDNAEILSLDIYGEGEQMQKWFLQALNKYFIKSEKTAPVKKKTKQKVQRNFYRLTYDSILTIISFSIKPYEQRSKSTIFYGAIRDICFYNKDKVLLIETITDENILFINERIKDKFPIIETSPSDHQLLDKDKIDRILREHNINARNIKEIARIIPAKLSKDY